ncbi:SMI1/KNR4 family protein [Pseudomonas sp. ICMP22404]|uniref:SMI1/KNR4 family protein n=1 Tax=Pseudomonas sp. ICMP22404 TaxID=2583807 RepID=UPI00111B8D3A|nr:SMI1/KNR4 family protein [Pseudomonas sp. ICMP22404]TNF80349.1 SMI1/KNR4 family protein [Pseudomonas sp. ICMP22404]
MKKSVEIRSLIDAITTAELYEGDYGDCITNVDAILSGVDESDRKGVPVDYLEFLADFGFGELDAAFYVDDGPVKYSSISGREIDGYDGVYVFAGNSSDVLYAFDSKNSWSVVEISSEVDGFKLLSMDFSGFILDKLRYVKGLVDWRAGN